MDKPEALRLADAIDPFVYPYAPDHLTSKVAAAELRRLARVKAQRDALLEALKMIAGTAPCADNLMGDKDIARAAIKAVEGENHAKSL